MVRSDSANRKTAMRFDREDSAKSDLGRRFAIVPGDPAKSELVQRITAENKGLRMPPVYSGRILSAAEIATLERWIAQGAKWQKHWSFTPPERPDFPTVTNRSWPRNGIDHFVLARLEQEGLAPSAEADKETLIRRVTLDLTGLPPTLAEIDAFLRDSNPGSYERVVDRLLASPRYGERMAIRWLDAARYADTNGYQTDGERSMWRWRDWVIDAFNRNMPFDRFTIEQLAGDMLPNATLEQKIATGFNRNHRGNGEGGIVPEEYAIEYVVDRVETTSTVWLGLTLGCARCHDHKYDPLAQKEFYRVFAYFNNIPEKGLAWKFNNSPPFIQAPTDRQVAERQSFEQNVRAAESAFAALQPQLTKAQRDWEASARDRKIPDWLASQDTVAYQPLGEDVEFDGKRSIDAGDAGAFNFDQPFTIAAWIKPTSPDGVVISKERDDRGVSDEVGRGYSLRLKNGKVLMNMAARWIDEAIRVETERELAPGEWHQVTVVYDGSVAASGVRIFIDGQPAKLHVLLDQLNQSFSVKEPLRLGSGGVAGDRFHGSLRDVRVYDLALDEAEVKWLAVPLSPAAILRIPPQNRSQPQAAKLARYFLDTEAPAPLRQAWRDVLEARRREADFSRSLPTVMVMQEQKTPRDTFTLIRGAYDRPGEKVSSGVPAAISTPGREMPKNRLEFARWVVDPSNPLTARVTVNRFWQMFFGRGIVKTVEDFGSQGEWPSHPQLLDWLSVEFVESGWDMKGIVRTIVTSTTYRQSSKASSELMAKDPDNQLLARGPRFRLPAEMIRDQALAVSGLLVEHQGGPSVKPYQPAGLWKELSGKADYPQDHGENLYRRSLYTFWKRTVPPPFMTTFDSAGRETCIVRENRTDTPLQALNLMNDVTYVEASRVLAQRMMTEGGAAPSDRISFAFRLATAHQPTPEKSRILLAGFHYYSDLYQTDPKTATKLVTEGEYPAPKNADVMELAAYTMVASMILNMDETVTKN